MVPNPSLSALYDSSFRTRLGGRGGSQPLQDLHRDLRTLIMDEHLNEFGQTTGYKPLREAHTVVAMPAVEDDGVTPCSCGIL
jgi:hypothetical protein